MTFARATLALAAGLCASGCGKVSIDYTGRPCGADQDCGDDPSYTCDAVENLCVTLGDPCLGEGRASPCAAGASDCSEQCRVCTEGVWSDCRSLAGDECVPGATTACAGGDLQICNIQGFFETVSCGGFGCNDQAAPARCNECDAGTTRCDGDVFVTCDAEGLVAARELCAVGNDCASLTCDPTAGCEVTGVAPNGSPCPGLDGARCTSSCIDGACVDATPPVCDDGNECTDDACDDALGCIEPFSAAGAACAGADADRCNSSCDGAGACREAVPVDCEMGPCSADTCAPATGECAHAPESANTPCRPPQGGPGGCDAAETCDGTSLQCPPDLFEDEDTPCGDPTDDACTDPDTCDALGACRPNHAPLQTACGDQTDTACDGADTCDGQGQCAPNLAAVGAPCGDQGVPCLEDDSCDGGGRCIDAGEAADDTPCGSAVASECDEADTCGGGVCQPNHVNNGTACGPQGPCDIPGQCQAGACTGGGLEDEGTACNVETPSDCSLPDTCDAAGACLANHAIDGTPCGDCPFRNWTYPPWDLPNRFPGGLCVSGCVDGACPACDGGPTAPSCTNDGDCTACDQNGPCQSAHCVHREHFACADDIGPSASSGGGPCLRSTCQESASVNVATAVGGDCAANGNVGTLTSTISYEFETSAVNDGEPFHVWMRNAVDDDHDEGDDEAYHCQLTGTTAGTYVFRVLRANASNRWGEDCEGVGTTPRYCWMALDGDRDAANGYQPVALSAGPHTLHCTITLDHGSEHSGFDGIIVTNDLYFVPDSTETRAVAGSCDDAAFTAGTCTDTTGAPFNWGPNARVGSAGACAWRSGVAGTPCAGCAGGGPCVCGTDGACIPTCDGGALDSGEHCDGTDLGAHTCQEHGFEAGQIGCTPSCTLDTTTCTSLCGDGALDTQEECEPSQPLGETCQSLGYGSGTLACTAGCLFDTSGCN